MSLLQKSRVVSETKVTQAPLPRRRVDRETTPGRCGNLDYCTIGMQRVQVRVPISQPFVCPECGGRLRPPGRLAGGGRPWVLPVLRVVFLLLAVAVSLGIGYSLGRVQPKVHAAVHEAGAGLNAASAVLGLSASPSPSKPAGMISPGALLARQTAPDQPTPPMFVADRLYPAKALPVDQSNPATRLAREARFGQVTVDCTLESVLTHPVCHVSDIRGADAFSAAAVKWLQGMTVQYAPSPRTGTPTLLDHRWRVTFQDFSGVPTSAVH